MAYRMTDYFHAHKDATTHDILSHKHALHGRAREMTVVFVMHATGQYSVYILSTREVSVLYDQTWNVDRPPRCCVRKDTECRLPKFRVSLQKLVFEGLFLKKNCSVDDRHCNVSMKTPYASRISLCGDLSVL